MNIVFLPGLSFLVYFFWTSVLSSDEVLRHIQPGDPDRKDILGAARIKVAADLGLSDPAKLLFTVNKSASGIPHMCVLGDWALLDVTPGTRTSGVWRPLIMDCSDGEDHLDNITVLLLTRANEDWRVIRGGSLCAGDVPWVNWRSEADLDEVVPQGIYRCLKTQ